MDNEAAWKEFVQVLCDRRLARACWAPGDRGDNLCWRLYLYTRIYARARSITMNLPNADDNNTGLRGPLDLLLMRSVRHYCFHRLLESHFGGWGSTADYRTALVLDSTVKVPKCPFAAGAVISVP